MTADGVHEHKGLFLRATLALGAEVGQGSQADAGSAGDSRYEGITREWTLAVGGAVSRSFVVYGEYMNTKLIDDEDRDDWSARASGLGVGFVYYLPRVLFFSATGLFERISVDVGSAELQRNRLAAALALKLGAEFWAAKQIGLGGYMGLHTASTSQFDASTESGWTTTSISFGISAVYN